MSLPNFTPSIFPDQLNFSMQKDPSNIELLAQMTARIKKRERSKDVMKEVAGHKITGAAGDTLELQDSGQGGNLELQGSGQRRSIKLQDSGCGGSQELEGRGRGRSQELAGGDGLGREAMFMMGQRENRRREEREEGDEGQEGDGRYKKEGYNRYKTADSVR